MREAIVSAAAAGAASAPSWTDVLAAVGGVVAALAAVSTVVVAIVAARYAKRQVDGLREQLTYARQQVEGLQDQLAEARTLRREQAQPYVVVSAVSSRVSPQAVEIVIQNLGSTGARDVAIGCTPPLVRTDQRGGAEPVRLPATIPFLAPGQEWRTFWDHGVERSREVYDLPDRYELTVTYSDSFGDTHTTPSVLDWGLFRQRMWVTEKTVHTVAKVLESIDRTLKPLVRANHVQRVAVYDGPQLDRQAAEEQARTTRELEELDAQIRREPRPPDATGGGQP